MKDISDRDLSRLAKGILALLQDPEDLNPAICALQSMDDLGPDLNKASIKLMDYLMARQKLKAKGWK